jgi:23S rRNA (cytidine1920-2'-O)/16S rRNA (cytidine1409-2'-O)-methyltransferase
MRKLETIMKRLLREHPDLDDAEDTLRQHQVTIDGVPVTNPRTLVRPEARVRLLRSPSLRGSVKLRAALAAFAVDVAGRVALDLGAATGGFTTQLLAAGARRVYAVDVGHGQLLGSLRHDTRVVNLERTNLALLDRARVPDVVELVTMDLSYLAVASAVAQLDGVAFAPTAELVALVKPMFELACATAPRDHESLAEALLSAAAAVERHGWRVLSSFASPVAGGNGAREGWLHARLMSAWPSR